MWNFFFRNERELTLKTKREFSLKIFTQIENTLKITFFFIRLIRVDVDDTIDSVFSVFSFDRKIRKQSGKNKLEFHSVDEWDEATEDPERFFRVFFYVLYLISNSFYLVKWNNRKEKRWRRQFFLVKKSVDDWTNEKQLSSHQLSVSERTVFCALVVSVSFAFSCFTLAFLSIFSLSLSSALDLRTSAISFLLYSAFALFFMCFIARCGHVHGANSLYCFMHIDWTRMREEFFLYNSMVVVYLCTRNENRKSSTSIDVKRTALAIERAIYTRTRFCWFRACIFVVVARRTSPIQAFVCEFFLLIRRSDTNRKESRALNERFSSYRVSFGRMCEEHWFQRLQSLRIAATSGSGSDITTTGPTQIFRRPYIFEIDSDDSGGPLRNKTHM